MAKLDTSPTSSDKTAIYQNKIFYLIQEHPVSSHTELFFL